MADFPNCNRCGEALAIFEITIEDVKVDVPDLGGREAWRVTYACPRCGLDDYGLPSGRSRTGSPRSLTS